MLEIARIAAASMRPRGQTPWMLLNPVQGVPPTSFNEATGADPVDAQSVESFARFSSPRFNEATGADPVDASASQATSAASAMASMRPRGQTPWMLSSCRKNEPVVPTLQ